jgi:integrase
MPAFQTRPLAAINKAEITAFIHGKIGTLAPGTINRLLNLLKAIFSRAIEWGIGGLEKNPAHGIKQLALTHRRERFLSPDEGERLRLAVLKSPNRMLAPIVAFLLLTGCRKREALDAKWEHIDLEKRQMLIPLAKSGKPRSVVLSVSAVQALMQAKDILLQEMGDAAAECPWPFANPITQRPFVTVFTSWDTARQTAGLAEVRMHDLRHSFASSLVNRGATLYDVQHLLGHSSPTMTERYSHLSQSRLSAAASEAEAYYTSVRRTETPFPSDPK